MLRSTPMRTSSLAINSICRWGRVHSAFTLTELLVSIAIISILASLSFSGIMASRRRAREVKTETTIRKIHEVIMPHFERFLHRGSIPQINPATLTFATDTPSIVRDKFSSLISKRRIQALEMPDSWVDVAPTIDDLDPDNSRHTAISQRLRTMCPAGVSGGSFDSSLADAECLWAMVMRGGFADPGIISHFRADEFGDRNKNGAREFLDGWGNPVRFLRWAPAFVSRYQPQPAWASADTRSHDVFDMAAIDPLALNTLFPLVFSAGADGVPDIIYRDPTVSYKAVRFDPYFVARDSHGYVIRGGGIHSVAAYEPNMGSRIWPNCFSQNAATATEIAYSTAVLTAGYGAKISTSNDDMTNHSMSR